MTEYNYGDSELARAAVRTSQVHSRIGEKIPCPYCKGKPSEDRNECGFCENGIHTIGS